MGDDRPFRYTKRSLSYETKGRWIYLAMFIRFTMWGFRRTKPIFYHPLGLIGTVLTAWLLVVSPWLLLAPFLAAFAWFVGWPDSYVKHAHPRWVSFLAGWKYRHRPRRKLTACGLLNDKDPVPTVSNVTKVGCITRVRIKMIHGDEIEMWRMHAAQLAQTYNAGDCRINPYRRDNFLTFRVDKFTRRPPFVQYRFAEKTPKYRWLELEFLTKDPFTKRIGAEYLDWYASEDLMAEQGVPVGPCRTGQPYLLDLRGIHLLVVAMSRRGKSNAARTMLRAYHRQVQARLMEFWGIDGKGGVEFSFMQHLLTRYCYGDDYTDETAFRPEAFAQMLNEAKIVMMRRQRRMRTVTTKHTATPDEPWVVIMIDELLALTSKLIKPEIRNDIAANIALIQQQGIACGVTIVAFSQLAQKEEIPFRGGFTEFQVGRSEAIVADMLFGTGSWKAGARVDEIPKDLPGVFYAKNDFTLSPEQFRYVETTDADVRDLAGAPESALWDSREVVVNLPPPKPEPKWENPPDPPLESPLPDLEEELAGELVSVAAAPEEFQPPPEPPPVKKSGPSFGGMR
jgi:hypothetical protein